MSRVLALALALSILALLVGGCGQQAAPAAATATPSAQDSGGAAASAEVVLKNLTFQPKELTVAVGTTVTWRNEDSFPHTVTAGTRGAPSGLFDSGELGSGGTFSFTFDKAGRYDYHCSLHPGMDGVVVVQ